MTLLVISPDYASHLLPLATLATAWRDAGERVVVATGPATAPIVRDFGLEHHELALGRGNNARIVRTEEQEAEESASLQGFFDATRRGMIPTLRYQAHERLTDLMWQPVETGRRVLDLVALLEPDEIIVDHLAFSARVALQAAGIAYGDVVLGHPTALPVAGEVYGYAPFWPSEFSPEAEELAELRALCEQVSASFTAQWNSAALAINPEALPTQDAFAEHGARVLYNYPAALADGDGRQLPPHEFLGSTRRTEPADEEVDAWIATGEPYAYVSFGSFLSVRDDVLARVSAALSKIGMRTAIATGSTPTSALGALPDAWLVREYLPQVRLLGEASFAVTHGGNNSVTEAIGQGVPLVVLPFSTDQFAGAAAISRTGLGESLDPNAATVDELAASFARVRDLPDTARSLLSTIAAEQRETPGPQIAYATLRSAHSETS
ncbi:UDP:flavonoid glycosyltransferase YjiC (YdhE family) [Microbacterium halimionae]|uniref:UDP:flavonoid glycosyltransferase YjiC (YdhE family) n=1 Tax=Microbacterium halimionae TaxID=1526413 RepID=A0A7W3JPN4_9MICO|nr:glycosyltransferase [Microbacterium halimionae]MBA8816573.1 UDP:flavonoid glycosyltransferase YjiC (YdhE family) [Microbacterium halimionae]NII95240.1 UDP:flavonoid glycosyltransferase YjiC (YdhE family) [Microbacterium halimionae]